MHKIKKQRNDAFIHVLKTKNVVLVMNIISSIIFIIIIITVSQVVCVCDQNSVKVEKCSINCRFFLFLDFYFVEDGFKTRAGVWVPPTPVCGVAPCRCGVDLTQRCCCCCCGQRSQCVHGFICPEVERDPVLSTCPKAAGTSRFMGFMSDQLQVQ